MVIDTSALLAILLQEIDAEHHAASIAKAPMRLLSAGSYTEASIVLISREKYDAVRHLDELIRDAEVSVVSVDAEHALLAREAFRRFGKGRHPASLNFGDCFSYALAKASGHTLLFKGSGFSKTDILPALRA